MSIEKTKTVLENTVAFKRLESLFDEGTFSQIAPFTMSGDNYTEAAAGYGKVNGCSVYAFAQNSDICGGAMSKAQSAKLLKLYELALKTGTPVIGLYDSKGARIDQGIEMMKMYGDILSYSGKLAGVVPQISVILGSCQGTAALLAACADFIIMSEEGKLTVKTNGDGGSAESNKKHGISAITAKDEFAAIEAAKNLITMFPRNNLSDPYISDVIPPIGDDGIISIFTDAGSFTQLFEGYADAATVGFAKVEGETVGIVKTNGELLDRRSCEKCSKIIRFCDAYSIPVITLADAKEFECIKAAAKLTAAYAEATTVKVTVITGETYGAYYMACANTGSASDFTAALEGASVSPVTPEAGIIIMNPERLKTDAEGRKKAINEYKANECSAMRAAEMGYIDNAVTAAELRTLLVSVLEMLADKREATLPKKHSTI